MKSRKAGPSAGKGEDDRISQLMLSLSSSSDLNPLIDLTATLRRRLLHGEGVSTEEVARKGLVFLAKSLETLLNDARIPLAIVNGDGFLQMAKAKGNDNTKSEATRQVEEWLQGRWNDTILLLCQITKSRDQQLRLLALKLLMDLQREASSALSHQSPSPSEIGARTSAQWSRSPWIALMKALMDDISESETLPGQSSETPEDLLTAFTESFLQQYDDVRLAFCRYVSASLQSKTVPAHTILRRHAMQCLLSLTAIPREQGDLNTFWIKEMEDSRRSAKADRSSKKEKEMQKEDSEVEDWFSDSDEERGNEKDRANGLGKVARAVSEKTAAHRRLRRNPAFSDAVHSISAQRVNFSRAWLAVLLPARTTAGKVVGGSLNAAMVHEALVRMHTQILPHLSNPNMLHDFLVDALDAGGATALLALNALFTLMTKHNLNYPSFYARLYALLLADPPVLHVRYRSRFLRMLDIFLSSTHLPAALIASFAKRLSRMALRAPASAIVVVIPFVWNLCKRHKHCLGLLHREFGHDRLDIGPAGLPDPYDARETDPLKTNAIESSLWELAAMGAQLGAVQQTSGSVESDGQAHYLASVSSLSRILAEPFTKERYGLEDFLDLTYGTMFESEVNKTLRRREGKKAVEPAVAYELPRDQAGKRANTFTIHAPLRERTSKRARLVADEQEEEVEEEGRVAELGSDHYQSARPNGEANVPLITNQLFVF